MVADVEKIMFCIRCGNEFGQGEEFCRNCGAAQNWVSNIVRQQHVYQGTQQQQEKK